MVHKEDAIQYISKKLYGFNGTDVLTYAWNAGENVMFFGKGGFGKSEGAILFHNFLKSIGETKQDKPFVLSFGQGMTPDKLFAGIDLKAFKDEGEIRYNIYKSFIEYEYIIFEEMWDAFPAVLLELKNVLQSRMVQMGTEWYPIKCRMIVACTNKSRDEVITDNSLEALFQRFVYEREIGWSSFKEHDYFNALLCANGETDDTASVYYRIVAKICAESAAEANGYCPSPRTAGKLLKSILLNGGDTQCVHGFFGLSKFLAKTLQTYSVVIEDERQKSDIRETTAKFTAICENIKKNPRGIAAAIATKKLVKEIYDVEPAGLRDKVILFYKQQKKIWAKELDEVWNHVRNLTKHAKPGTLAHKLYKSTWKGFNYDLLNENHQSGISRKLRSKQAIKREVKKAHEILQTYQTS